VKGRKQRPLKWNDDAGVAALVNDEFLEWERQDAMEWVDRFEPDFSASELFARMEYNAVQAAERGDFRPLAEMLEQKNPFIRWLRRDLKFHLGPKAEALLAGRITGKNSGKRRRGRPKQTVEQRHANSKVHGAADELKDIEAILRWHYPHEKKIRERAISIAAERAGKRRQTLVNYLKSKRRMRHLP
jgi:hypothetical protein